MERVHLILILAFSVAAGVLVTQLPDATPAQSDATPAQSDATPAQSDATPAQSDATEEQAVDLTLYLSLLGLSSAIIGWWVRREILTNEKDHKEFRNDIKKVLSGDIAWLDILIKK